MSRRPGHAYRRRINGTQVLYLDRCAGARDRVSPDREPRALATDELSSGFTLERSSLVDPASSHMLVSKIKPCMSQCMPN